VNLVEDGHGENLADTRNGAESEEVIGVVDLGLSCEKQFDVLDEEIVVAGELDIGGDALEDGRVRERLSDTLSIATVVDANFRGREIVLVMSVLDVGEEMSSLPHQFETSAKKIPGGAHLGWINVSLRKHASTKQGRDLERVDAVILGFASMDGFHVERVTEHEVDAFVPTKVREPVPSEYAFDRDHEVLSEWCDCLQEDFGIRGQVSM